MANVNYLLSRRSIFFLSFEHEVYIKIPIFVSAQPSNVNRPILCQKATCVELFGALLLFLISFCFQLPERLENSQNDRKAVIGKPERPESHNDQKTGTIRKAGTTGLSNAPIF
jgi:hypothetical protein